MNFMSASYPAHSVGNENSIINIIVLSLLRILHRDNGSDFIKRSDLAGGRDLGAEAYERHRCPEDYIRLFGT